MASRGHLGGLSWTTPAGAARARRRRLRRGPRRDRRRRARARSRSPGWPTRRSCCWRPAWATGSRPPRPGILEIGDVYVVNKADRDGADAIRPRPALTCSPWASGPRGLWRPPIVKTVASRGEGLDELVAAMDKHRAWLERTGERRRRVRRAATRSRPSRWRPCEPLGNLRGHDWPTAPRPSWRGRTTPTRRPTTSSLTSPDGQSGSAAARRNVGYVWLANSARIYLVLSATICRTGKRADIRVSERDWLPERASAPLVDATAGASWLLGQPQPSRLDADAGGHPSW